MQYGDQKLNNDFLVSYFGAPYQPSDNESAYSFEPSRETRHSQRDAHLLHLRLEVYVVLGH